MPTADLRYAWRSLIKRPLFAAVVVLTLGLGIGVNSAIFSIVNAALFSALPVRAPGELLNIYTTDSARRAMGNTSYPDYAWLREHARAFSGIAAYSGLMTTITGQGTPEVLFGEIVSGNYFDVTGARLALGRGFLPAEDATPGTHPVVVIGHRLWQRRFGGDPGIVGRTITLNGHPFTVVGVADREFTGLLFRGLSADLWAPVMMMGQLRKDQLSDRGERWLFVKGRLAAGVPPERAVEELRVLGARASTEFPASNRGRGFGGVPTTDVLLTPDGDTAVLSAAVMVLVLVGLVLLIAAMNLANLMLARAAARRREIAVRLALGASRLQLVRQLAAESALLAALGGALGLAFAYWLARLLVAFRPPTPVPLALDVAIDWHVLAYTGGLTLLAALVVGLVPALQATRGSVSAGLSAHGEAPSGRISRLRQLFLIPQIAFSLALLVLAGLFVRSVGNAGAVDPGFDIARTAVLALDLRLDGYDDARAATFYDGLERRLADLPGVQAVSVTDRIPLDLYGNLSTAVTLPAAGGRDAESTTLQVAHVDERYFDALGVRLVAGRSFAEDELRTEAPVAVVSAAMAARWWPRGDAIGQQLREGDEGKLVEIVGIAPDVKVQTLGESPQPLLYRPLSAGRARLLRVVVRTGGDPRAIADAFRREVAALDADVAVFESTTMARHLDLMLFPFRLAAQVSSALGLFALLLASVGLYGVIAFGVARRTREFGIRMALGARAGDVLRLVMSGSLRVVSVGLAIGLVLALGIGRVASGILFGIGGNDPLTVLAMLALLLTVSLLAAWLPARRATRVSPAVALRED